VEAYNGSMNKQMKTVKQKIKTESLVHFSTDEVQRNSAGKGKH
jgi:hypothetical protein